MLAKQVIIYILTCPLASFLTLPLMPSSFYLFIFTMFKSVYSYFKNLFIQNFMYVFNELWTHSPLLNFPRLTPTHTLSNFIFLSSPRFFLPLSPSAFYHTPVLIKITQSPANAVSLCIDVGPSTRVGEATNGHSPQKSCSSSPGSHQVPIVPQQGWGLMSTYHLLC